MRLVIVVSTVLLIGSSTAARDLAARRVTPAIDWTSASLAKFDAHWLHVKLVEGTEVGDLSAISKLIGDAVAIRPTFGADHAKLHAWKALGEAASGQVGPDLSLWFDVRLAGDRETLAATINALNALDVIEIAHPAPICEPAAIVTPAALACQVLPGLGETTPDFTEFQDYLYDTPVGLDAPSAWAQPGGRGAGMKFIDVELGWAWGHEDFDPVRQFYQGVNFDSSGEDHGTAVVGEVVGQDNGYGITGFAGDAQWGTVGITIPEWPDVPHYFMEAVEALDPGDVWLIELQMFPPGFDATPMEWLQVNYDVIWTSSWALGVVCVEAGANGGQDLDDPAWQGVFDRNVRDSGAILVGAGGPFDREAEPFSNYGSRMDAHGWGSQIVTTGYGDLYNGGSDETEYTSSFSGTSGASPMVAGAALCLQGISSAAHGQPMTPDQVRQLITDTGIPNVGTDYIGPRPDLGAAVVELLTGSCAADVNDDQVVDVLDFLELLGAWNTPDADLNGDGTTDTVDFLLLLAAWGPC